jgi:hypothetical protein
VHVATCTPAAQLFISIIHYGTNTEDSPLYRNTQMKSGPFRTLQKYDHPSATASPPPRTTDASPPLSPHTAQRKLCTFLSRPFPPCNCTRNPDSFTDPPPSTRSPHSLPPTQQPECYPSESDRNQASSNMTIQLCTADQVAYHHYEFASPISPNMI